MPPFTPAPKPLYDVFSPEHRLFEHNANLASQGLAPVTELPPPTQLQAEMAAGLRPVVNGTNQHMAPAAPAPAMPTPAAPAAPAGPSFTEALVNQALNPTNAAPAPAPVQPAHWSERGAALFGSSK